MRIAGISSQTIDIIQFGLEQCQEIPMMQGLHDLRCLLRRGLSDPRGDSFLMRIGFY